MLRACPPTGQNGTSVDALPNSRPPAPLRAAPPSRRVLLRFWRGARFRRTPWPWLLTAGLLALLLRHDLLAATLAGVGVLGLLLSITRRLMWSLRNRLLVTYVFVAVIPVILVFTMALLGAYIFDGGYATSLFYSRLRHLQQRVQLLNQLTLPTGGAPPNAAPVTLQGVRTLLIPSAPGQAKRTARTPALALPTWLGTRFSGLVLRSDAAPELVAFRRDPSEAVLSRLPLSPALLDKMFDGLGVVALRSTPLYAPPPNAGRIRRDFSRVQAHLPGRQPVFNIVASTQPLPPARNSLDFAIHFGAPLEAIDWKTGKTVPVLLYVQTRPSALNQQLFDFGSRQPWSPLSVLLVVGTVFLVLEVVALYIGIRLTRSITGAVDNLYNGTRHVNQGDFAYRIPVRTRDQLSDLALSFNGMTESIQTLLVQQRENQQLESELAIAHEVQTQLFPQTAPEVQGLDVYGLCLPARVVSGDYYDFLLLNQERLAVSVGDISGKGISAALLMASIASALRAHQASHQGAASLRPRLEMPPTSALTLAVETTAPPALPLSPSQLMEALNRQLYATTPPEKYATMFYAEVYPRERRLCYCTAGHLPPAVLGRRGRRRLSAGGTVLGLFPDIIAEQEEIPVEPGDLLVIWSDGLTEPENAYGEEFGEDRLLTLLEQHLDQPLQELAHTAARALREWTVDPELPDDLTLVLVRVRH